MGPSVSHQPAAAHPHPLPAAEQIALQFANLTTNYVDSCVPHQRDSSCVCFAQIDRLVRQHQCDGRKQHTLRRSPTRTEHDFSKRHARYAWLGYTRHEFEQPDAERTNQYRTNRSANGSCALPASSANSATPRQWSTSSIHRCSVRERASAERLRPVIQTEHRALQALQIERLDSNRTEWYASNRKSRYVERGRFHWDFSCTRFAQPSYSLTYCTASPPALCLTIMGTFPRSGSA